MRPGYSKTIWRQLLNDAPFAWYLRDQAVVSPVYHKSDVDELDAKLNDYIAAIRAGIASDMSPLDHLDLDDPGSIYVLMSLAIREKNNEYLSAALGAIEHSHEKARELYQVFASHRISSNLLKKIINSDNPYVRQASVAAIKSTTKKEDLSNLLSDESYVVTQVMLKKVGMLRKFDCLDYVQQHYQHEDDQVRFNAITAGMLLGDGRAENLLADYTTKTSDFHREAIELQFRLGSQDKINDLVDFYLAQNSSDRIKALVISHSGYFTNISKLLSIMEPVMTAQVAGESFSLLTGLDLVDNHLEEETPDGDEPSSAEKSEIDNEYRNYEELLPWPSVEKVTAWWADNSDGISLDKRYLAGLEITPENLNEVLKIGTQTQRYAAALELARLMPNDSLIDTKVI